METKPGIYTTEFWVTLLTLLAVFISAVADKLSPHWAAIAGAIAAGLYAVARGLAKQGAVPAANVPANAKLLPRRRDMHPRT